MIFDSRPYRNRLITFATSVEKRATQKRWSEGALANFEIECFSAFYIVRKLMEASKLPQIVTSKKYKLTSYPWTNPKRHRRNPDNLSCYYNFDRSKTVHKSYSPAIQIDETPCQKMIRYDNRFNT